MKRSHLFEYEVSNVFDVVIEGALKSFNRPNLDRNKLQGLSMKKNIKNQLNQNVSVVQTVVDYKENEVYSVQTESKKDIYTTTYRFLPKNGKTLLEYEETFKSASMLRNANQFVMGLVYFKRMKKKTQMLFAHILRELSK